MKTAYPNGNASLTHTVQALRASELSYRRMFEAAKDGNLLLNEEPPGENIIQ